MKNFFRSSKLIVTIILIGGLILINIKVGPSKLEPDFLDNKIKISANTAEAYEPVNATCFLMRQCYGGLSCNGPGTFYPHPMCSIVCDAGAFIHCPEKPPPA